MSEMVERVARALWRLDNPADGGFSGVAPNNWDAWPEHGRAASLAQVDHCKDDYRDQARAAIKAWWRYLSEKTTELNEDAVEIAAMALWEEYPEPLPAWASIPEMSMTPVSRADLRRMARTSIRAYRGAEAHE